MRFYRQRIGCRGTERGIVKNTPRRDSLCHFFFDDAGDALEYIGSVGRVINAGRAVESPVRNAVIAAGYTRLRYAGRVRGDARDAVTPEHRLDFIREPCLVSGFEHDIP